MRFSHLHFHTDNSLQDGMISSEKAIQKAVELSQRALAITDHGNINGAYSFHTTAIKNNILPIIGVELYVIKDKAEQIRKSVDRDERHIVLLAKNTAGFYKILELVNDSHQNFYYKPHTDLETIKRVCKGSNDIFALTACIGGIVCKDILNNEIRQAEDKILELKSIFNSNLYLEVMPHMHWKQENVNRELVRMGKELGVPLVATNDVHYLEKSHNKLYDYMRLLTFNKTVKDKDAEKFKSDFRELYFKSHSQMLYTFCLQNILSDNEIKEAMDNVEHIVDSCEAIEFNKQSKFAGLYTDSHKILCEAVDKNFEALGLNKRSRYKRRLSLELDLIMKKQFSEYFLVMYKLIQHCKKHSLIVGLGRGSAAGSLVSYVLGITKLDPIKFNLIFERFLNEDRKEFPDIDTDFGTEDRKKVKEYLKKEYGENNVYDIGTFSTYQIKAIVRDLHRVLDLNDKSLLAEVAQIKDFDNLNSFKYLKEKYPDVFEYTKLLLDNRRHVSKHAAGVIISNKNINEYIPIIRAGSDTYVTGFIEATGRVMMPELSSLGFIKFDLLGLRNLTIIKECLGYLNTTLDEFNIFSKLEDKKVLDEFTAGHTKGVFQFESPPMRDILKRLRIDSVEDLIATCALHRPGPIESGMIEKYIKHKHSNYIDSSIIGKVLKNTYGQIVYQEQIMQLAQKLAKYSLTEADELRKMITKFKTTDKFVMPEFVEIIKRHEIRFLRGAESSGLQTKEVKKLWKDICEFAKYSFNRSHSASYAITGYLTMYLKVHHPLEYMAAILNNSDDDKVHMYLSEVERLGYKILPVDINYSQANYSIDKKHNGIRSGLILCKGIAEKTANKIISQRPFKDFNNFKEKCGEAISKKIKKHTYFSEISTLKELNKTLQACKDCKNYTLNKRDVVLGDRNNIMIIAQSPNGDGIYYEAPFGLNLKKGYRTSGIHLYRALNMVGLKFKKDFCITNTIKCATDNIPKENIENCRKYLVKEIEIIQPKLIIALGTVAMRALNDSVTRGNMIELANGIKVIGNWHPAYVARDVTRQKDFFNNFTNFRKEIINAR